jgi:hypothetical protein
VNDPATAVWAGFNGAPHLTSFDDTSATPGTIYYYWVRAVKWASTDYCYGSFSILDTGYRGLSIPPLVPTGLTASDGTYANKVSLHWNVVAGAHGYQVYRNTVNNSEGAEWLCFNGGSNRTSYDDTSVTPGTTYYYWVRSLVLVSGTYSYSSFSTADTGYAATSLQAGAAPSAEAVDQLDLESLVAAELGHGAESETNLDWLSVL